jgi:hypothetical protein
MRSIPSSSLALEALIRTHIPSHRRTLLPHHGHSRRSCPGALARRNTRSQAKLAPQSAGYPRSAVEL